MNFEYTFSTVHHYQSVSAVLMYVHMLQVHVFFLFCRRLWFKVIKYVIMPSSDDATQNRFNINFFSSKFHLLLSEEYESVRFNLAAKPCRAKSTGMT